MGRKPKTRIEGDAEVETIEEAGAKKRKARKQEPLFTMTAEERTKAMKERRAEFLESRQAFEDSDDELAKLKRTHKTAEDRFEKARDEFLAICADEAI